ncbi:MAG: hypothetical protein V3V47_01880 [Desulfobacteria bacterium]
MPTDDPFDKHVELSGKKRLNLELDPAIFTTLTELKTKLQAASLSEVIRRAIISLEKFTTEEMRKRDPLITVEGGKVRLA